MRSEEAIAERMAMLQENINRLGNLNYENEAAWHHYCDRLAELEWVLMKDDIEFPPSREYGLDDRGGL